MDAVLKSILFPALAMLGALIALFIVLTVGYKVLRVRADAIPANLVSDRRLGAGEWKVEIGVPRCDGVEVVYPRTGTGTVFVQCSLMAKGAH